MYESDFSKEKGMPKGKDMPEPRMNMNKMPKKNMAQRKKGAMERAIRNET